MLVQQRLEANVVSLIAARREEARVTPCTTRWHLKPVRGLRLSPGAIVEATQRVAQNTQAEPAAMMERIRSSPVVHADETGWRDDGHNGAIYQQSP